MTDNALHDRLAAAEKVVEAAREVVLTPCQPESRGLYCDSGHGRWPCAVEELRRALAALDGEEGR